MGRAREKHGAEVKLVLKVLRFGKILTAMILASIFTVGAAQAQSTPALLLFGGENNRTFLGCLNCSKYDAGSICNKYGEAGSKYNSGSVWNSYGEFGSKYSANSPWNKYSNSAPVFVDRLGKFYGHLSANKYHSARTRITAFNQLADISTDISDLEKIRDVFCGE